MIEELKQAIRKSGLSALQLSKETGVAQPTITEFLRGADMRLSTAQKLANYLGLKLEGEAESRLS
jgi:transcriptional regulator with XRE-family HTH domain